MSGEKGNMTQTRVVTHDSKQAAETTNTNSRTKVRLKVKDIM